MTIHGEAACGAAHEHVFLGAGHERNERRTWAVIALCAAMMVAEIVGGTLFGSLALVADGLHMSTHAGAMLIAACAYTYARRHATDPRFVFGTGKLGDLAGFTSAIVLAMIALLIGYEAVSRFLAPVSIRFNEAIPLAVVGLLVNLASVWLLAGDHHGHAHGHRRHEHPGHDEVRRIDTAAGVLTLSIFEDGVPPVFRVAAADLAPMPNADAVSVTTIRADGARQAFAFANRGDYFESVDAIPEPHEFAAIVSVAGGEYTVDFAEPGHARGHAARDHNIRSAYFHVMGDAAVSLLAIVGLALARAFGWVWMDPLAGIVGALVIGSWSYGLLRDTGAVLLDMNTDRRLADGVRHVIEAAGDEVVDLHVWRVGPGHMSAALSIATGDVRRGPAFYHAALARFAALSHVTVEVNPLRAVG